MSVGPTTVGGDEDSACVGIFLLTHVSPPFFDGGDGEDRCVMVDSHRDPGAVVGEVVDPVGNGFAVGLIGEVIGRNLDWLTLWMPFLAGLGVPPDEFSFWYRR